MKLYNTVKSLILEVASIDSVVDAIKKKHKVVIYYDGDEPGGRGLRVIEPVCFGYSKSDNPVLRAWDEENVKGACQGFMSVLRGGSRTCINVVKLALYASYCNELVKGHAPRT